MSEELRYPAGHPDRKPNLTAAERRELVDQIAAMPDQLRAAVAGWTDAQLDTPYRPEGWTARQVVHHLADSHMHSYTRFRFGLAEDHPTVKPYDEAAWANLTDARTAPVDWSLQLVESVHRRWVMLMRSLDETSFARTVIHPENGVMTLDQVLQIYSWHGRHHVAHITGLARRSGW
ncbi:MAG: YfiT family bacillithiol transferase [Bryobacteraceae bacterium]